MRFLSLTSLLLLTLVFIPVSLPKITSHECASPTPPPVSGTLVQPPATSGTLFINEVMLIPHTIWNCSELYNPTYARDTWIEIYNAQNQAFALYSSHTYLDSGTGTSPLYLPFGASIAPHGFLVVFLQTTSYFSATETRTFRLLVGGTSVDEVLIPPLDMDYSYARFPDGSTNWEITNKPTIDASNTVTVVSPTPKGTKVKATATARALSQHQKNSKSDRGGTSGGGSSTDSNGDNTDTSNGQQIDGTQPTWSSLKHSDSITTATPSANTQSTNTDLTVNSSDLDVPHKILLTGLVVALLGVLLWCWRLFRPT